MIYAPNLKTVIEQQFFNTCVSICFMPCIKYINDSGFLESEL